MSWIYYLLEANLYLVAFYALYYLLFRSETHYQLNRAYLLISTVLAFIIPVIQIGIFTHPVIQQQSTVAAPETTQSYAVYYLWAYGIVAFCLFLNFLLKVYKLVRLSHTYKTGANTDYKLIEMPGENNAFSFFSYLYISPGLALSSTIIQHELVHIKQRHSWDNIYLELLKIVNWFNPAIYLLQNSMKEVHEFIADSQTAATETNTEIYTDFLINNAYGINQNTLINTFFNKSQLKKRIIMLHQKRSGNAARLKYLLVLPLIFGLLCASTVVFANNYKLVNLFPAATDTNRLLLHKDTIPPPPPPAPPKKAKASIKLKKLPPPPPPAPPVTKADTKKLPPPPPPAPPKPLVDQVKLPPYGVKHKHKVDQVKFPPPVVKPAN